MSLLTLSAASVLTALASPAAAEECPNAAFRAGPSAHLPDCRAYELVTPPFKNNGRLEMRATSPGGSPVEVNIGAATAGDEALSNVEPFTTGPAALYSIARTTLGWATVSQELPDSEYMAGTEDFNNFLGESLGGQDQVYAARKVGQPENSDGLFMRRPDGSIVEVGPALPSTAKPGDPKDLSEQSELHWAGMSADGSRYLFYLSRNHWPGDGTEDSLPNVYEYLGVENTGPPLLVGVDNEGRQIGQCGVELGGLPSLQYNLPRITHNAVSANGNTVFFTVLPADYGRQHCGRSAPPVAEVFARVDNGLPGAHTVAISEPSEEDCSACYANGVLTSAGQLAEGVFVGASEDGSKVFFETTQPLLGGDSSNNVYEYDFDAPRGQRVMRVSAGDATVSNPSAEVMQGNGGDYLWFQVSQDGSHVYFLAHGVLTKTPNVYGESAEAGAPNLYVVERDAAYPSGRVAFVTRLAPADLVASGEVGLQSNVTPDGRLLVFTSNRDLTPDDTSATRQAFEYDALTGALVRVSIGEGGYNHNGNSPTNFTTIVHPFYEAFSNPSAYWSGLSVSADGSYVFFESPAALTPDALEGIKSISRGVVKGYTNVYEYHNGRVSLVSDGQDTAGVAGDSVVRLLGTDASGGDVFFTTVDRLVGQDLDSSLDIYDARVGGGFPPPAAPASCTGEGCQGALSAAPTLLSPGSEFQAGGNPPLAGEGPAAQPKAKPKPKKRRRRGGARGAKRRGGTQKRSSGKRRGGS
ncbi:MAG: hypothetical protein ACRDLF_05755 [Solirubrobacteraceae bacterium]